jgi:hypothetical protein
MNTADTRYVTVMARGVRPGTGSLRPTRPTPPRDGTAAVTNGRVQRLQIDGSEQDRLSGMKHCTPLFLIASQSDMTSLDASRFGFAERPDQASSGSISLGYAAI